MDQATAVTAPAEAATTQAPAVSSPAAAGTTLQSVPAGEWFNNFKNPDIKSFMAERKFADPETLAQSYVNLEKLKGVPENRLLKLPEKMEGDEARAVFQKLGAPLEAKGYELPRDEKSSDPKFLEWAEGTFHKNHLTKSQAQSLATEFNGFVKAQNDAQALTQQNARVQADAKLQAEWGAKYDVNINLAKQGAKILGLDEKTLNTIEALQGRDVLFKNLQRIGVSVGESTFVDGNTGTATTKTPEEAQAEIKTLLNDEKFRKKVTRGDTEATARWNELNRLASPGEKQII